MLQEWDPIVVKDCRACATEYSSYAPEIADPVARGASPETIATRLAWIEKNVMNSRADPDTVYEVALILLWPNLRRDA